MATHNFGICLSVCQRLLIPVQTGDSGEEVDDGDDDDGNLCFHVEILHSLEELHRKADVVKLYWEANLAKIT